MPKVSVIVPIYNVENYIEKCLQSLVNQTLQDIEIILVNDGSQDDSGQIAKQYQQTYPDKFRYVEKINGGLGDARNFGMPYASGDYLAFLDSDDYVESTIYQELYEKAKQEQSDMVECDFYWDYPKKRKEDKGILYEGKKEMLIQARVVAWNKLIKRERIEKNNLMFPKKLRYEDVEFFYQLVPYLNNVSFVKKPLIHYIQRSNSISNQQNERTKEIFEVLDHVLEYYHSHGFYEEYKVELEYVYSRYSLCSSFKRINHITDKQTRNKLLEFTWENLHQKFPDWKSNPYLYQDGFKNHYMRSINRITYPIYSKMFQLI